MGTEGRDRTEGEEDKEGVQGERVRKKKRE